MEDIKHVLFGHIEAQLHEAILHFEPARSSRVPSTYRPPRGYVLVDVPSKEIKYKTDAEDGAFTRSVYKTRDI
jgi:hypothetical protein